MRRAEVGEIGATEKKGYKENNSNGNNECSPIKVGKCGHAWGELDSTDKPSSPRRNRKQTKARKAEARKAVPKASWLLLVALSCCGR
jgi:hypothetical protein